jgi:Peptidase family M23
MTRSGGGAGILQDSSYAFVYSPDGPVEQVSLANGAMSYLLSDSGGSVRGIVNGSTGAVTASTTYDAFGNPTTAAVNQGGVNYPGVTLNTPIGAGASYTDPTALQGDGSVLADPTGAQRLSSLAASGNRNGHMFVFRGPKALGYCGAPRGSVYTGESKLKNAHGVRVPKACKGNFYKEGDHKNLELDAIDLQMYPGNKIFAQYAGTVGFVGENDGEGLYVVVNYANGITAWYAHMTKATVHSGQPVRGAVTQLGLSGGVVGAPTSGRTRWAARTRGLGYGCGVRVAGVPSTPQQRQQMQDLNSCWRASAQADPVVHTLHQAREECRSLCVFQSDWI